MRKKWAITFGVLGALALLYLARTVYVVTCDPMRAFDTFPASTAAPVPPSARALATPSPAPTVSPEEALSRQSDTNFMKQRVNILLVGFDQSDEREKAGTSVSRDKRNNYRSDVLMLAAVDFEQRRVHLISIPRDTYTPIYNTRGRWKINAAFAKGGAAEGEGFTYATKTVEMLFGVPVAYYAGVDMNGLKRVVDAIGGVDYDVDVEIHLNGRTLEPGMQHLSGQQVLDYVRARKGISADTGRNDRQQRMLVAVFEEMREQNQLVTIPALYAAVRDDLYTNLTAAQIAALAKFALDLNPADIRRTTLDGEYVSGVYNASYYVLRNKSLVKLVEEEFGVTIERSSKYDLSKVKRDKAAAAARRAAEQLEDVEAMLLIPVDATGAPQERLLSDAQSAAERLMVAVDCDASEKELARLHDALMRAVAKLFAAYGVTENVPEAFRTLVL